MPNNQFPGEDFLNFGNDPLRKEENELQKIMHSILGKLNQTDKSPVTNSDLLQYLRVINFNFAALQRLIQALYIRQGLTEESVTHISTKQAEILEKVDAFFESQTLLQEALDDPTQDQDEIEPV